MQEKNHHRVYSIPAASYGLPDFLVALDYVFCFASPRITTRLGEYVLLGGWDVVIAAEGE